MLRDKEGNRLFRRVELRVIFPDRIFPDRVITQRAGPHQGFGPAGIADILLQAADQLETLYPFWDFKPLELSPVGRTTRWVFTFAGYRAMHGVDAAAGHLMVDHIKESRQPIADSTTPVSETAEALTESAIKEAVGATLQELPSLEQALGDFR